MKKWGGTLTGDPDFVSAPPLKTLFHHTQPVIAVIDTQPNRCDTVP